MLSQAGLTLFAKICLSTCIYGYWKIILGNIAHIGQETSLWYIQNQFHIIFLLGIWCWKYRALLLCRVAFERHRMQLLTENSVLPIWWLMPNIFWKCKLIKEYDLPLVLLILFHTQMIHTFMNLYTFLHFCKQKTLQSSGSENLHPNTVEL